MNLVNLSIIAKSVEIAIRLKTYYFCFVVQPLISESPTQEINGNTTVTIEKMLVDIFCDPIVFSAQQGSEMDQIFKEAFEKYTISESKMLRYASRRRKKTELDNYLNEISKYRQQC